MALNVEAKKEFLFHSGIVLTGANKSLSTGSTSFHNDGIVTAFEVMNLDLTNTRLVVLFACATGLGKIENGEGVFGLQRSFMQAGARNVLISLWKVEDEATRDLMISFYQYLGWEIPCMIPLKKRSLIRQNWWQTLHAGVDLFWWKQLVARCRFPVCPCRKFHQRFSGVSFIFSQNLS